MSGSLIAIIVILVLLSGAGRDHLLCLLQDPEKTAGYLPDVIRNGLHDRGNEAERSGSGDDTEVGLLRNQPVHAVHYAGFPGVPL